MQLSDYRDLIDLGVPLHPWPRLDPQVLKPADLAMVLEFLRQEDRGVPMRQVDVLDEIDARLTLRPATALPAAVTQALDRLLAARRALRGLTRIAEIPTIDRALPDSLYPAARLTSLWRGDITTLQADAIVNAANSAMLGCFIPFHACIDNAIHRIAGPGLRADCQKIMQRLGSPEATGTARVTRGYHLPAAFVLHTVGPIIADKPTDGDRALLGDCYRACLDLAAELPAIRSVAFCAISTGVFRFPKPEAASIALATVADWLGGHPSRLDRVVFNVFSEEDAAVYQAALEAWR